MIAGLVCAWMLGGALTLDASQSTLYTNPFFRNVGVAEGLPSSSVRRLALDQDGYLWIGTADGLVRYDGVNFHVYRHDPADATSLHANDVWAILIDRDDRVWSGGENAGLNMLDTGRKNFVHYAHNEADPASLGADDVYAIAQTRDGRIWIGGYGSGVDVLNPDGLGFTHLRHHKEDANSLASDTVLALHSDPQGNLWIGMQAGIDVLDVAGHIRHVDVSALPDKLRINAISFAADGQNGMLISTRQGLVRVNAALEAEAVPNLALIDKFSYTLARDHAGDLWVGNRQGVGRILADNRVENYTLNAYLPGSLRGGLIYDVLVDREGSVWLTSFDGGIAMLPPNWRDFASFRPEPANDTTLSSNRVTGLATDSRGGIWSVNFEGGIDRLDPESGKVERFAAQLGGAPSATLRSVFYDAKGRLWVGHNGVRVYALSDKTFTDLPVDPSRDDALRRGLVTAFLQDASANAVWVAVNGSGMYRVDSDTLHIERFDGDSAGLRSQDINQIGFDPAGSLLVAGARGIERFDTQTKHFDVISGIPDQRVLEFVFLRDGTLWLHTLGALERYRYVVGKAQRIDRLDATNGWPMLTSGSMAVDGQGRLWVSSARGLWRADPAQRSVRQFDTHDDLPSAEFSTAPLVQRADGSIFGATLGGIIGFNPAHMYENKTDSKTVFDSASVRRAERKVALDVHAPIALDWNDRDLTISARVLSFVNPAANRYQWQLAGYDKDWVETDESGERLFSQLPAGHYRLTVRAANAAGIWSTVEKSLDITQAAPPWATRGAFLLYAMLLTLAAVLGIRAYRKRLERRHAYALTQQQRLAAEQASAAKTSFLATMGHEIRTPMTGVLGMAELLARTNLDARQRGYVETIQNSGNMMLRLVNDSLDLARIEAGKLELEDNKVDLYTLFDDVAALGRTLATHKGLVFHHAIAADAPRVVRGDAVRIKQIFLNLLNNAIKFTEHGRVDIELGRAQHAAVKFVVRDTGPGIAQSTRARLFQRFEQEQGTQQRYGGSGLGLAICRELVARMNGEIVLDSVMGEGSKFTVTLPLAEIDEVELPPTQTALSAEFDSATNLPVALRCLLVEDDATVASVISGMLEAEGHSVRHVGQGLAALAEFDSANFDIAIVDLDLPGIDGLALARMLRAREQQEHRARLPIIGISARSVGDEEALCLAAGMDAFLRKPIRVATLNASLRAAVLKTEP